MANALYDKGRQKFLEGDIAWLTASIRAMLADFADYTANLATDDFFDDVTTAGRIGNAGGTDRADAALLGTKTSTDGVADAADSVLTLVTGDQAEGLFIFKDTGADGTSPLIALIDTATGLPITPNGGDITIAWDAGANRIFKL